MIRKYEIMFLFNPKIDEKNLSNLIEKIEKKLDGKIVKKEEWGKKEISYPIKKHKEAIYFLYYIETKSENIEELKKIILIEKNVLRHLIIRHDKKWPFESKRLDLSLIVKRNSNNNKKWNTPKNDQ